MKNFFAIFTLILLGISPLSAQQTIFLRHDDPIRGTVLWDRTTTDRLFFQSTDNSGESLVQFIPSRKVEYIDCDSCKFVYKGPRKGWQPWKGDSFTSTPRHGMLYGVSGGIITDGWSVDASAMRYVNWSNFFGVGLFARYAENTPFKQKDDVWGYSYRNQAFSLGIQLEFRGYIQRLKTFYYLQIGGGCSYHHFGNWQPKGYGYESRFDEEDLDGMIKQMGYPTSEWAPTAHGKIGIYTRLTCGLYGDLSFGCVARWVDDTTSDALSKFAKSDRYPLCVSLGLRFGRED